MEATLSKPCDTTSQTASHAESGEPKKLHAVQNSRHKQPPIQISLLGDCAPHAAHKQNIDTAGKFDAATMPSGVTVSLYIADMISELQAMAHREGLDVLCMMLAMAQEQAQDDAQIVLRSERK
jgi:hypothetical protein